MTCLVDKYFLQNILLKFFSSDLAYCSLYGLGINSVTLCSGLGRANGSYDEENQQSFDYQSYNRLGVVQWQGSDGEENANSQLADWELVVDLEMRPMTL